MLSRFAVSSFPALNRCIDLERACKREVAMNGDATRVAFRRPQPHLLRSGAFARASDARPVRSLGSQLADELGKVGMTEKLPDRVGFAVVIPVVIDHPLERGADGFGEWLSVHDQIFRQSVPGETVEI